MYKGILWLTVTLIFFSISLQMEAKHAAAAKSWKVISQDGVEIVYLSRGTGEVSLVFIHGGFADKGYWHNQVKRFGETFRVIAVDLAGHGQSGKNRAKLSMKTFAGDVKAVIEKEKLNRIILIGNSLGGPVALETTRLMPDKVLGIVGVDTFNDFQDKRPAGFYKKLARSMRTNFKVVMGNMAESLFHSGEKHPLYPELTKKMLAFPPEIAANLMESFDGYHRLETLKQVPHPIRCIMGDMYPMRVEKNRQVHKDFDAVIIKETGHYPMLERPKLFNGHLETIIAEFLKK